MVRKSKENGSDSVAPFLTKCYEMVDDEATDSIISWSQPESCNSFVIWDMTEFSVKLLPLYFKHNNFSSFMRQLNIYVSFSFPLLYWVFIRIVVNSVRQDRVFVLRVVCTWVLFLLWVFELSFNVCVCEILFSFLLGCLVIPCLHWVFFNQILIFVQK